MTEIKQNAIELNDISKSYITGEIKVIALDNIKLNVRIGEKLAVLGPSGSGKTTLLNLLGGITNPDLEKGKIRIFHEEIQNYKLKKLNNYRKTRIGFIFQFFNLFPTLTALENVIIGCELLLEKRENSIDIYKIAKEYLEKVGLEKRLNHYPSQLSGGEQQRVAIARALVKIPFIGKNFLLLLDEPTGNLDSNTSKKIITLIGDLNEKEGITCILVTHDEPLAKLFASRIVHLENGKIINDNGDL